jgi:glycerol uptake facilitator-like aquaporin
VPRFITWFVQSAFSYGAAVAAAFASDYTLRRSGTNFAPNNSLAHSYGTTFLAEFIFYGGVVYVFYNAFEHSHAAENAYKFMKAYQSKEFNPPLFHLQKDGDIYVSTLDKDAGYMVARSAHGGTFATNSYTNEDSPKVHFLAGLLYFVGVFILAGISGSFMNINLTLAFNTMESDFSGNWWYCWIAQITGVAVATIYMMYKGRRHRMNLVINAVALNVTRRDPTLLTPEKKDQLDGYIANAPFYYNQIETQRYNQRLQADQDRQMKEYEARQQRVGQMPQMSNPAYGVYNPDIPRLANQVTMPHYYQGYAPQPLPGDIRQPLPGTRQAVQERENVRQSGQETSEAVNAEDL